MPRGGRRPGAGRKPGSLTQKTKAVAEQLLLTGETPLEFALAVMRSPDAGLRVRMDACKAALPHMHPRLNSIEHAGEDGGPIKVILNGADADL